MENDSGERDSDRLHPDDEGGRGAHVDDIHQVREWVDGLPSGDDLIPLSQPLVSPELASAFSIPLPDLKNMLDIHSAAQHTISNLRRHHNNASNCSPPSIPLKALHAVDQKGDSSPLPAENSSADDSSGRIPKRPRLVWTPHLHKRFVAVVAHLGIQNVVPKTIMQLMNVDGLTRENVASHLQKYRLYLKRMQGLSSEGPSSSDHLFASTPVPQSFREQQQMPYAVPTIIPMQVYGMPHHHHAHGMVPVDNQQGAQFYNGFDSFQPYPPNELSAAGSKFASIVSNPHVSPNDNNRTGEKQTH